MTSEAAPREGPIVGHIDAVVPKKTQNQVSAWNSNQPSQLSTVTTATSSFGIASNPFVAGHDDDVATDDGHRTTSPVTYSPHSAFVAEKHAANYVPTTVLGHRKSIAAMMASPSQPMANTQPSMTQNVTQGTSHLSEVLNAHAATVLYKGRTVDRRCFDVWRIDGVTVEPKNTAQMPGWSGRISTIVSDMGRFAGIDGYFSINGGDQKSFEQKISTKQVQRPDGSWTWRTIVIQQDDTNLVPNWTTVIEIERRYLTTQFPSHLGSRDFTWIQGTDPTGQLFALFESSSGINWSRLSRTKRMFRDTVPLSLRGSNHHADHIASTHAPARVPEMDWVLEVHVSEYPTSTSAMLPQHSTAPFSTLKHDDKFTPSPPNPPHPVHFNSAHAAAAAAATVAPCAKCGHPRTSTGQQQPRPLPQPPLQQQPVTVARLNALDAAVSTAYPARHISGTNYHNVNTKNDDDDDHASSTYEEASSVRRDPTPEAAAATRRYMASVGASISGASTLGEGPGTATSTRAPPPGEGKTKGLPNRIEATAPSEASAAVDIGPHVPGPMSGQRGSHVPGQISALVPRPKLQSIGNSGAAATLVMADDSTLRDGTANGRPALAPVAAPVSANPVVPKAVIPAAAAAPAIGHATVTPAATPTATAGPAIPTTDMRTAPAPALDALASAMPTPVIPTSAGIPAGSASIITSGHTQLHTEVGRNTEADKQKATSDLAGKPEPSSSMGTSVDSASVPRSQDLVTAALASVETTIPAAANCHNDSDEAVAKRASGLLAAITRSKVPR